METLWALRWSRLSLIPVSIGGGSAREQFRMKKRMTESEIELHRELNDARVVARRDDASEIAWADDLSGRTEVCCWYGVEVADRIGKVYLIEEIEELGAEFEVL